jgi:hypothetical protein
MVNVGIVAKYREEKNRSIIPPLTVVPSVVLQVDNVCVDGNMSNITMFWNWSSNNVL